MHKVCIIGVCHHGPLFDWRQQIESVKNMWKYKICVFKEITKKCDILTY